MITNINPIDGMPFTVADADRLLGLADQFMEDWEASMKDETDPTEVKACTERRIEYDAIRPLLVEAPALMAAAQALLGPAQNFVETTADPEYVDEDAETIDTVERVEAYLEQFATKSA